MLLNLSLAVFSSVNTIRPDSGFELNLSGNKKILGMIEYGISKSDRFLPNSCKDLTPLPEAGRGEKKRKYNISLC